MIKQVLSFFRTFDIEIFETEIEYGISFIFDDYEETIYKYMEKWWNESI